MYGVDLAPPARRDVGRALLSAVIVVLAVVVLFLAVFPGGQPPRHQRGDDRLPAGSAVTAGP